MDPGQLIQAFVARLSEMRGLPSLRVDHWPDQNDSTAPEIDAIAAHFAIEHTSVDTLPDQRRDTVWFGEIAEPIRAELSATLPYRLYVHIEYGSIKASHRRKMIAQELREWILSESPQLREGYQLVSCPGIPFPLHVNKRSDRRPLLILGRLLPKDEGLEARIRTLLAKKASKLAKYQQTKTTILLVENHDIVLTDTPFMIDAIHKAFPDGPPTGVHEIWYADTSIPEDLTFNHCVGPWRDSEATDQLVS
jgi:hypothetical protein